MKRVAIFGGSFNPPGLQHQQIAIYLSRCFDEVIVVPCGGRPDKDSTNHIEPIHRAAMADLAFSHLPNVEVDLFDLDNDAYTPTVELIERYGNRGEVWVAIGSDLIAGGAAGKSPIQSYWRNGSKLWQEGNFIIVPRPDNEIVEADLPPHHQVLRVDKSHISSSLIRSKIAWNEEVKDFLSPQVLSYITRHALYHSHLSIGCYSSRMTTGRIALVVDENNEKARSVAEELRERQDLSVVSIEKAEMIVVAGGDGTMLHTVQRLWRKRLPFFGINCGHRGFMLNQIAAAEFPRPDAVLSGFLCPFLRVDTVSSEGKPAVNLAFNDSYVNRQESQAAWISIEINGELWVPRLEGDGALVSTPAGSTAYASSMGAYPVPIGARVLVLAGNNVAWPLGWQHANLTTEDKVVIRNIDQTQNRKRPIKGFCDNLDLGTVDQMTIQLSRFAAAELLFLPGNDFHRKLRERQFPWKGQMND